MLKAMLLNIVMKARVLQNRIVLLVHFTRYEC